MGLISSIGKGLKYTGIAARTVARYSVGNGAEVISNARKAATPAGTSWFKSIFSKKAAKAGWKALKQDVVKTATSKKSLWKSITSFGKSLITKPQAGWRLAGMKAAAAGKTAGFFTKLGGAFKGLGKACKKLPLIGTLITIGFEIPEIYKAFTHKDGGFWEGMKQIGKSTLKIAAGTALSAIGACFAGPIGGAIGYMAGEWLMGKILGGDFSENHQEASNEENPSESQKPDDNTPQGERTSNNTTTSQQSMPTQTYVPEYNTGFGDLVASIKNTRVNPTINNPFIFNNAYSTYTGAANYSIPYLNTYNTNTAYQLPTDENGLANYSLTNQKFRYMP